MDKFRKIFLWAGLIIGIAWFIFGYQSFAKQWEGANPTYFKYFEEGGFSTLLMPIGLSLFLYFGFYYLFACLIMGIVAAVIFSLSNKTGDVEGLIIPGFIFLGFVLGIVLQIAVGIFHRIKANKNPDSLG